jgi:hypothetical protein
MRRVAVGVALCAALAAPAAAHASSSAVLYSEQGDHVGNGQHRLLHDGNATFLTRGDASELMIMMAGGLDGEDFTVMVAAPPGEELEEGVYTDIEDAPLRSAGRPGLFVFGDGRACDLIDGSFEVEDIEVAPAGEVTRLWLHFEQRCAGRRPALFGELRWAQPDSGAAALALPTEVHWPELDLGGAAETVPVSVVAGESAVTVDSVSVTGPAEGDFAVELDECSGSEVAPGEFCDVWVSFVPGMGGTRSGTLHVAGDEGLDLEVPLVGFAHGGFTQVLLDGEVGNWVGRDRVFAYDPSVASIGVTGDSRKVVFRVESLNGENWQATFEAPAGQQLAPGVTGTGVDVSGNGRACSQTGSFQVSEAAFRPSGRPLHLGVGFVQLCEDSPAMLCGMFEFRTPNGSAKPPAECDPGEEPPAEEPPADNPPGQTQAQASGGQTQSSAEPTAPSNMFVVKRVRVGRRGVSTHVVELPGPGALELVATTRIRSPRGPGARRVVARARRTISTAGLTSIRLRPSRAGRALLKRHRRLRVRVVTRFTPNGGQARARSATLVLRRRG